MKKHEMKKRKIIGGEQYGKNYKYNGRKRHNQSQQT